MSIKEEEQKKQQLKAAIKGLPDEVVRDALVLSLTGGAASSGNAEQKNLETEGFKDIFELLVYLKRTYSFPELEYLVIEGGKMFFKDGDRRILMAEKKIGMPVPPQRPVAGIGGGEIKTETENHPSAGDSERFSRLELDD